MSKDHMLEFGFLNHNTSRCSSRKGVTPFLPVIRVTTDTSDTKINKRKAQQIHLTTVLQDTGAIRMKTQRYQGNAPIFCSGFREQGQSCRNVVGRKEMM